MIRRGISLAMAAVTLIVYLQSQLASNDALFLFTSSNLLVNIGMIGLASTSVWLSFQSKFSTARTYLTALCASFTLTFIGIVGLLSAGFDRYLFDVIKPMDYALLLEAGIVFGICTLSYEHPKASLRLPAFNFVRLRHLAADLSIPSIPQTRGRSRPSQA